MISKHEPERQKVVIAWIAGWSPDMARRPWDGSIKFLNSYQGIRVYEKDRYDPRLDMGREFPIPYFDEPELAIEYMQATNGQWGMCQIALTKHARRVLNLERETFSNFSSAASL